MQNKPHAAKKDRIYWHTMRPIFTSKLLKQVGLIP